MLLMLPSMFGCEQGEVPQPPPPAEPPALTPGKLPPGIDPSKLPPGTNPGQLPPGVDPSKLPPGVDPSKLPPGVNPGQLPPGVNPQAMGAIFGLTKQTAIKVCDPGGERDYLSKLRCPGGGTPQFNRVGNVGPRNPGPGTNMALMINSKVVLPAGVIDEHIIDEYEVTCAGGVKTKVYMDMYHCLDPDPLQNVGFLQAPGAAAPTAPTAPTQ